MQVIITINSVAPGSSLGPNFTLSADVGSVVPNIATLAELLAGKLVTIDSNATIVFATSMGKCDTVVDFPIATTTTTANPCAEAICGVTYEGYGYLYNWYAIYGNGILPIPSVVDGRNPGGIVNTLQPVGTPNTWVVPTSFNYIDLQDYLGGVFVAGGKLKTTCTFPLTTNNGLWLTPNSGATNEVNWAGVPGGFRRGDTGQFGFINYVAVYMLSSYDNGAQYLFYDIPWASGPEYSIPGSGRSIRLVRPATIAEQALPDGTTSNDNLLLPHYVGNSRTYITVKIGNQIWTAQNLIDDLYNDGTSILEQQDDIAWINLTTGARCRYDNMDFGDVYPTGQIQLCGVTVYS